MSDKISIDIEDDSKIQNLDIINDLNEIIKNIEENVYPEDILQEISQFGKTFTKGKRENLDKETIRYMITGWWICQCLDKDNKSHS
jgi:hypothetical protein